MRADHPESERPTAEDVEFWRREIAWRRQALDQPFVSAEVKQELHFEIDARMNAIHRAEASALAPPRPAPKPSTKPKFMLTGSSKLTDGAVREIRRRYGNGGETRVSLAAEFGVTESTIGRVVHRMAYRHVEDEGGGP